MASATDSLSHRGPDDRGVFVDDLHGVGLGHRRLSIIDLSEAGHQPMEIEDRRYVVVYNGEIYNFQKIKSELTGFGHRFTSRSDTEVILRAYQHWGTRCLKKFIGMFVFAIWDRSNRFLFLARDRLGIKPLYYYCKNQTFLFGSELKALMAFSGFERQVDPDAFQLYLHYQYVPAPKTIFMNTCKLEPGSFLIFNGKEIKKSRWWEIDQRESRHPDSELKSESANIDRLDDLLTQSVSDRMISDVPLGALLSGGVDSSIIVALMQKVSHTPIKTFTIGFNEEGYNEAHLAKKIANHLGTDHTELYVSSQDAMQVIPKLPEIYDEPFADSSSIPTFLISQLTRSQVTVALSGDGGDEQFAGYFRYWASATLASWLKWCPVSIRKGIEKQIGTISITKLTKLYNAIRENLPQRLQIENFPDKWQKFVKLIGKTELSELYRLSICIWTNDDIKRVTGHTVPFGTFEQFFNTSQEMDPINRLTAVDQLTYLPDAMLTKVDRASMAAGLEVRVPLLDHRVVEFTSKLPVSHKLRNGKGKYIAKKLLCNYVPRELVERPKMGFGVPIAQWLKKDLKNLLNDYLSPAHLKREARLDYKIVSKMVHEHMSGKTNHQHRLWALLMWEMWRERWMD